MEERYSFKELLSLHFRTYKDQYVKRVWSKCGNFHSAEEIVQDAYVKAMCYPPVDVDTLSAFNFWFFRVVVNAMHDYYRKEDIRKRADLSCFEQELLKVLNVEDTAVREIILNRELDAKSLDVKERVVYDRFKLQMKTRDIASRYSVSHSNVRQIVNRFQKDLEKRYGEDLRR